MVSTFLSAFPGQWRRPGDDYKDAIKSSLIVLDTNILLGLYRFTPAARKELFDVLSKTQDRLWVPHQVVEEYYRRRIDAVKEHIDLYEEVPKAISDHKAKILTEIRNFANRCSLSGDDKRDLIDPIEASIKDVLEKIKNHEEKFDLTLEKVVNADPIMSALAQLLDGRTGHPFSAEERESLLKEFANRVEKKIPPGYRDAGKRENSHGDFFLWEQVICESKARSMPVLLVTNDAKEDWVHREAGFIVGARPELILEMRTRADTDLLVTQLGLFLKSAKAELGAAVSPSTVAQAESLRSKSSPPARRLKVRKHLLPHLISELSSRIDESNKELESLEQALSAQGGTEYNRNDLWTLLRKQLESHEELSTSLSCVRTNIVGEGTQGCIIGFPNEATFERARSALLAVGRRQRQIFHSSPARIDTYEGSRKNPSIREEIDNLLTAQEHARAERDHMKDRLAEARQRTREGDPKAIDEYSAIEKSLHHSEMMLDLLGEQLRVLLERLEGGEPS